MLCTIAAMSCLSTVDARRYQCNLNFLQGLIIALQDIETIDNSVCFFTRNFDSDSPNYQSPNCNIMRCYKAKDAGATCDNLQMDYCEIRKDGDKVSKHKWNDRVGAVWVGKNVQLRGCPASNYGGVCKKISSDQGDFFTQSFDEYGNMLTEMSSYKISQK